MFLKNYIYLNFAASVFLFVRGYTISNENNQGKCILPSHPQNGKWVIIGGSEASPGSPVPTNSIISFSCNDPYTISGDYSKIICLGKEWNPAPPECLNVEKIQKVKSEAIITRTGHGEILIKNDGNPNAHTRQRITLSGSVGDGIVLESDGNKLILSSEQGESLGENGKDGIAIESEGEMLVGSEGVSIRIDKKGIQIGGSGGDGIVIGTDGKTVIVTPREGESINLDAKRLTAGGKGGMVFINGNTGGQEVLKVAENTEQRGDGQTIYEGHRGQDGLVIENGEAVNGSVIGIGLPGGSGQQIGGRGGDGIVLNGEELNGVVVGIGGQGGNAGSINSNDKGKEGEGEETLPSTATNQNENARKKRQTITTYRSESSSYSKSESSSYSKVSWSTFTVGGGGGHGVVIYGGTINGNVYGVGGASGK